MRDAIRPGAASPESPASPAVTELILRPPLPRDGAAVWRLVRESGALEHNSAYAYLLFLDCFRDTCLVCGADEELLGFVLAFRPPRRP